MQDRLNNPPGIATSGGDLLDPDFDAWNDAIRTNLYGVLYGIKVLLPLVMKDGGSGSLVATTSGAGIHGTAYKGAAYAATKNSELTIMECLYGQLVDSKSDVHVGIVIPPLTRTNLAGDDSGVWEYVKRSLAESSGDPVSIVEPEQFAEVIVEGIRDRVSGSKAPKSRTTDYWAGTTSVRPLGGLPACKRKRTRLSIISLRLSTCGESALA